MSRHPQIVPPVENDTPVETSQDLQGNSIRTSCENGSNCVVGTRGCVGGKRVDMLNNPNCIKGLSRVITLIQMDRRKSGLLIVVLRVGPSRMRTC